MIITGKTKVLGVFGHPIAHSVSPAMHNAAIKALGLDYIYVPFHVLPELLESAVTGTRALNISGFNVTIPHKENVIKYLDDISKTAERIRSVNTVVNKDNKLYGHSTDGEGFIRSLEASFGNIIGCKTAILGAGGSARAVGYALADANCSIVFFNRTVKRAVELADELNNYYSRKVASALSLSDDLLSESLKDIDLIVNTTSVGMSPDNDGIPISPLFLGSDHMVYDLVYNPLQTRLVFEALEKGARAANGLGMLVYQGAVAFEMWTGKPAPVDVMYAAALKCFEK
ncbi:MAG: shikimate dehydrogenase [Armatimonadota bacterium]